jgi:hypothetical protein
MLRALGDVQATVVRVQTTGRGCRPAVLLGPDLSSEQRRAVRTFELERRMPGLLSSMPDPATKAVHERSG